MYRAFILSKTEYGSSQYCIGGITVKDHQFIRLLEPGGYYQPRTTKLEIGDIWDITFQKAAATREPHNEDVIVTSKNYIRKIYGLKTYINNLGVKIWRGNITNAFDGYLGWAGSGSGYLSENQSTLPAHSVGFWIPNKDLKLKAGYYWYDNKRLPYKGTETAKSVIPSGSLIRLSLAKWWCPDNFFEDRCYLQLSGWYEDKPEPVSKPKPKPVMASASSSESSIYDIIYNSPSRPSPTSSSKLNTSNTYKSSTSNTRPTVTHNSRSKNTSGGCYIATVCYNDFYAEEVCTFRDFRDHTLRKSSLGRKFISYYYRNAPEISEKLHKMPTANAIIKNVILNNLLRLIKLLRLNQP